MTHGRRLPDDMITKIRDLHQQGYTPYRISKMLGVDRATVEGHCGRRCRSPATRRNLDDITVARIRDLRRQGMTYRRISQQLGICRDTARYYCSDLPSPARRGGHPGYPADIRDAVLQLHAAGYAPWEISEQYHGSPSASTIQRWVCAPTRRAEGRIE